MAAVNLTLANDFPRDIAATSRRYFPTYTGSAAYAAGGDTGLADALGIGKIFVVLGTISDGVDVLIPYYDQATGKLMWFNDGTGNEAAGDLSAFSGVLEVIGQ